jgi:hypothetical protein
MRAKVSKQRRTTPTLAKNGKRLRIPSVVGPYEYSEAVALEEPRRTAVSIYAEETESKDHEEEPAA